MVFLDVGRTKHKQGSISTQYHHWDDKTGLSLY